MSTYTPPSPITYLGSIPTYNSADPTRCQESLASYLLYVLEDLSTTSFELIRSVDDALDPLTVEINTIRNWLIGGSANLQSCIDSALDGALTNWTKFNDLAVWIDTGDDSLTDAMRNAVNTGVTEALQNSGYVLSEDEKTSLLTYTDDITDVLGSFLGDVHTFVSEEGLPVPVEPGLPTPISPGDGIVSTIIKTVIRLSIRRVIKRILEGSKSGGNPNGAEQIAAAIDKLRLSGILSDFSLELDSGLGQSIRIYPREQYAEQGSP
jgi:hypothetical protein